MIELRLIEAGVQTAALPDIASFSISPVFCDQGAIEFTYPKDGTNWPYLDGKDEIRVAVYIDGVYQPQMDSILQDIDGDDVKESAVWKFTGFFNLGRMNEAVVYPPNWPNYDKLNTKFVLTNMTAGGVMQNLITAAKARGTLSDITFSTFNSNTDSNGAVWDKQITLELTPGLGLLEVLKTLYQSGMCEFQMIGTDLRMYRAGTFGVDRTTDPLTPLVFRRGRDLTDSPRKVSSRGLGTVMLGAGEEGLYFEKVNATAVASRRRIERAVSQGQVKDLGTLQAYTEAQLAMVDHAKMEKSHGLLFSDDATPRPIRDFDLGDWAFSDVGKGNERYRIRQWVLKLEANGNLTGSVQLNDLFDEQDALLTKRVAGIVGGSTITGASQAVNRVPTTDVDGVPPAAPSSLGLASAPFVDSDGNTWAQVTATWPQVTTNQDGTIITDLAGYQIAWHYLSSSVTWHNVDAPGTGTSVSWSPVGANSQIEARVRAYDKAGNFGNWSPIAGHTTQDDTTPPEKPATPVADNFAGLLHCYFNGKTASGAAWAPDIQYYMVHASTTANFTPDATTWVDTLTSAGDSYMDPGYGQSRYYRIVAVDRSGNWSVPSDPSAQVTTSQILNSDIFDGAVGTSKLADLTVTTAKIADLAVNNAKIGSVSAAKITAGLIVADLTVGARIATALTGARSEMNSTGFQAFDASGNLTVSITGTTNLMMGKYVTALTGRRIEIGAGGSVGEINFYGPQGQLGQIRGFTSDVGEWSTEAITMKYPISGTSPSWNQFSIGSNEQSFLSTGFLGLYIGGGGTGTQGLNINWLTSRGGVSQGINGQGYTRFQIDANSTFIAAPDSSIIAAFYNTSGSDYWVRLRARFSNANFGGTLDVIPYRTDTSPALRMFAPNMVSAAHMYWDSSSLFVSFTNGAANAYTDVRAASFNTTSDENAKKAIRRFSGAREKLAPLEAHTYALKGGKQINGRRRLGFMAASAPDEIRILPHKNDKIQHEGIDLYGLLTLGIQYSKEIDSDLDALRREVAELRKLVSK